MKSSKLQRKGIMKAPKPIRNVAIPPEVHEMVRLASIKRGMKIKVLVERALRQAYGKKASA